MTIETEYNTVNFAIGGKSVEIYTTPNSFRPNRVSDGFIRCLGDGQVSYDIGAGSGIISIAKALKGAKVIHAVEPSGPNYNLLLENIHKLGLEGKIIPHQGRYFDPLIDIEDADEISADVSGIPRKVGRGLGWYPSGVKTGGKEGYGITCELLGRARDQMKFSADIIFPTADDFLDANKILKVAYDNFGEENVRNALCSKEYKQAWLKTNEAKKKPWRAPDCIWFNLDVNDMGNLYKAYEGNFPDTIRLRRLEKGEDGWKIEERKGKDILEVFDLESGLEDGNPLRLKKGLKIFWTGTIWKARKL